MSVGTRLLSAPRGVYQFVRTYGRHLPQAFDAIFSMPCAVTKLHGRLKDSDDWVTVLYVGRRMNFAYLLRMIFEEYSEVEAVATNLFGFKKHMDRHSAGSDVIVIDLGWPYNYLFRRYSLEMPDWMNMELQFPEEWEEVVRNFRRTARKHDLRLIRRNNYRCEVATSREAIDSFYDEMYVPFVRNRHADEAEIAPRALVVKRALKGKLLHVLRGDEIIAAGVIYPEDEIMFSLWMGMPQRYVEQQPEAAISALYYFGMRYAFDNGYETFDFTGTRAFLKDGVYQFKRRWGPLIEDTFSLGSILIKPARANKKAALFCQQVPVLRRSPDGLEPLFVCVDGDVDEQAFSRLEKAFGCVGLDRLTVIELSERNETSAVPSRDEGCQYRLIRCTLDRFSEVYTTC